MSSIVTCVNCELSLDTLAPGARCPVCRETMREHSYLSANGMFDPLDALKSPLPSTRFMMHALPSDANGDFICNAPPAAVIPVATSMIVPNHTLWGIIGRGGMGIVYRAVQDTLGRICALKIGGANVCLDDARRMRFQTEVRALAQVESPFVVKVYEAGETQFGPFVSMEFVAGRSLHQLLLRQSFTTRESARIIRDAARGLEAIHVAGIIHRDVKPGNIMLTRSGHQVKVTDFGLARMLGETEGPTMDGTILGTPSYMAPEQARGHSDLIGPAADIYSLGATLYHLVTGLAPYHGTLQKKVVERVVAGPPTEPRVIRPNLSADLEAIVLKAMAREHHDRYDSAEALAADLDRWLNCESTIARPLSKTQRMGRWVHRKRAHFAAVAACCLVALGVTAANYQAQPHRQLERKLANATGPVEILGTTGTPLWHRFETGETPFGQSVLNDGAFNFNANGLTLLTLIDDPQHDHYQIEAEFRHMGGARQAMGTLTPTTSAHKVGLYCGYTHQAWDDHAQIHNCFATLYNEFKPIAKLRPPTTIFPQNVCTRMWFNVEQPNKFPTTGNFSIDEKALTFEGTDGPPGVWRKIRIRCSPTGFVGEWITANGPQLINQFTPADHFEAMNAANRWLAKLLPDREIRPPEWNPRRPIGIYALAASLDVRNIVFTPLVATSDAQ